MTCRNCSFEFEDFVQWLIHMNNHIDSGELGIGADPTPCRSCGVKVLTNAASLCSLCRFEVIMTKAVSPTWLISALVVDRQMTAAAVERRHKQTWQQRS
jgi:hypothetical protein